MPRRLHEVEMDLTVAVTYDPEERISAVSVEPEDLGLFDHVLATALTAFGSSQFG